VNYVFETDNPKAALAMEQETIEKLSTEYFLCNEQNRQGRRPQPSAALYTLSYDAISAHWDRTYLSGKAREKARETWCEDRIEYLMKQWRSLRRQRKNSEAEIVLAEIEQLTSMAEKFTAYQHHLQID
jgi:hypothetical protein